MKASELRNQTDSAMAKLLEEKRAELAGSVVQLHSKEVKNVRAIRGLKRDIARILTVQKQKAQGENS